MAYKVEFKKSGKILEWEDRYDSLLELAEDNGVEIDNDCRQGVCGTCAVKLISGEVDMEEETGLDYVDHPEEMILACTAVPKSDVVIDA